MRARAVTFPEVVQRWELLMALVLAIAASPAAAMAPAQAPAVPAQMPPPELVPEEIEMSTFYNGARVRIQGTAPRGSGVLVVIRGSEKDEFFNRQGRVGPIWMNVDKIHVEHAPSVFLSYSSAAVGSLLDPAAVAGYQLDEAAIISRIRFLSHSSQHSGAPDTVPDPSYARSLQVDFLRLKEREGCYCQQPRAVSLTATNLGTRYSLEFQWPRIVPAGSFRVEVFACREHQVIARSAATLQLVEVGFPAYMEKVAFESPWVYGAGAVLVAMLAGFLTDFLTTELRRRKQRPETAKQLRALEPTEVPPEPPQAHVEDSEAVHRN